MKQKIWRDKKNYYFYSFIKIKKSQLVLKGEKTFNPKINTLL
jgi:hypothetical protein